MRVLKILRSMINSFPKVSNLIIWEIQLGVNKETLKRRKNNTEKGENIPFDGTSYQSLVYLVLFRHITATTVKAIPRITRRDTTTGTTVDTMDDSSAELSSIVSFWLDEGTNVPVKFIGNTNNFFSVIYVIFLYTELYIFQNTIPPPLKNTE